MGNAGAAPSFGIAFKEFAYLEEKHDEHGFGKLRVGSGEETDAECAHGGDGHEEVFVEHVAVYDTFPRFSECFAADNEVRHEIEQQELPSGPTARSFHGVCRCEKYGCQHYLRHFPLHAAFAVLVMMVVFFTVRMGVFAATAATCLAMLFVCHKCFVVWFLCAKVGRVECNRVAMFSHGRNVRVEREVRRLRPHRGCICAKRASYTTSEF